MLFRYVWIIILILIWMIWITDIVLDIIDDIKYYGNKKCSFLDIIKIILDNDKFGTFIGIHLIVLLFISFIYWALTIRG